MEGRRRTHGFAVDRPNRRTTNAQTQTNPNKTVGRLDDWISVERILLRADDSIDFAQSDDG